MIQLRRAGYSDIDLLFNWANDPIVRKNSFHSEPIPYETHKNWFDNMMSDPHVIQFILTDDDIPVGQIRLSIDGEEAEIGYSIAEEFRGKGYGHKILQLTVEEVRTSIPEISKLTAKVRTDNILSKKLFESEGFDMRYSDYALSVKNSGGGYKLK